MKSAHPTASLFVFFKNFAGMGASFFQDVHGAGSVVFDIAGGAQVGVEGGGMVEFIHHDVVIKIRRRLLCEVTGVEGLN